MATKQQSDKADVAFGPGGTVEIDETLPVKPQGGGEEGSNVPAMREDYNLADEVDDGDIIVPYMVLVQKNSDLTSISGPGSIIYGDGVVLREPGEGVPPLRVVVAQIVKAYEEWKDFENDDGKRAERVYSKADVEARGGKVVRFRRPNVYCWRAVGLAKIAVQHPTLEEPDYLYTFKAPDGKCYAPARWTLRGASYSPVAAPWIMAEVNTAKPHGVTSDYYDIGVKLAEFTKGTKKVSYFEPTSTPCGPVDAATAEFFRR